MFGGQGLKSEGASLAIPHCAGIRNSMTQNEGLNDFMPESSSRIRPLDFLSNYLHCVGLIHKGKFGREHVLTTKFTFCTSAKHSQTDSCRL